jgi:hypothetical protein
MRLLLVREPPGAAGVQAYLEYALHGSAGEIDVRCVSGDRKLPRRATEARTIRYTESKLTLGHFLGSKQVAEPRSAEGRDRGGVY